MRCHEVDYEIIGHDLQMVEVELDPSESVIAEAGAMNYMEEDIDFEARMGDGSDATEGLFGKLMGVGKRVITGESIFMTHFTNHGAAKRRVAFAAPYPGHIAALNMAEHGERIYCQKDAFLCAALGTQVGIAFNRRLGAGFFGGEGFILQKLEGDGMAFLHAGGSIVRKELKGETLRVDTGCLVAFDDGIDYDIERAGGLKSMFFGGEGLFLATLQGHGTVWLQSMPFSRLADRIFANAPALEGKEQGEGSVLGRYPVGGWAEVPRPLSSKASGPVVAWCVGGGGSHVACGFGDGTVEVWDWTTLLALCGSLAPLPAARGFQLQTGRSKSQKQMQSPLLLLTSLLAIHASAAANVGEDDRLLVSCGTTEGTVQIELQPSWAPTGVDRFVHTGGPSR